jgi:hypothetical protein
MPTAKGSGIVHVVGAGFSAGLGYPLTSDLLVRLWDRLDADVPACGSCTRAFPQSTHLSHLLV